MKNNPKLNPEKKQIKSSPGGQMDPEFKKHLENGGYVWFNIFDLSIKPVILESNQFSGYFDLIDFLIKLTSKENKLSRKKDPVLVSQNQSTASFFQDKKADSWKDISTVKRKNLCRDFKTVFKNRDKRNWTDYNSRNTFGWKVLSIEDYNNFIVSEEAKKIFVKLGHSEIMGVDITNHDGEQVNSPLLNVTFTNDPPLGVIKNYQLKEFCFPFIGEAQNIKIFCASRRVRRQFCMQNC